MLSNQDEATLDLFVFGETRPLTAAIFMPNPYEDIGFGPRPTDATWRGIFEAYYSKVREDFDSIVNRWDLSASDGAEEDASRVWEPDLNEAQIQKATRGKKSRSLSNTVNIALDLFEWRTTWSEWPWPLYIDMRSAIPAEIPSIMLLRKWVPQARCMLNRTSECTVSVPRGDMAYPKKSKRATRLFAMRNMSQSTTDMSMTF